MEYQLKNIPLLKKILWADSLLGGVTALAGLFLYRLLTGFLGLPEHLIIIIATVTLLYAVLALRLALQHTPSVPLLRMLMHANWVWTVVSVALLIFYFHGATAFGVAFLILQVVVVAALAYLEGRHIHPVPQPGPSAG